MGALIRSHVHGTICDTGVSIQICIGQRSFGYIATSIQTGRAAGQTQIAIVIVASDAPGVSTIVGVTCKPGIGIDIALAISATPATLDAAIMYQRLIYYFIIIYLSACTHPAAVPVGP